MQITIDGKKCDASQGETILDVARRGGIEIPTLCFQEDLKPYGSCFICAVEVEGAPRLVPSCATPVADGMVVHTDSERVRASRKVCMELLLSDHVGDCRGPCQVECPAGIDIPGFISLLAEGDEALSIRLIKETMPFPASLGRVCPRPCEEQCTRLCQDEAVSICFLKRYVADVDLETDTPYVPEVASPTGKRVAIVGAGPAGLSAAFYLRKEGHEVVVFDAHAEPGGMLRWGIPAYRLPREVLAAEIDVIRRMGVDIRCGEKLGEDITLGGLAKDYDAVFMAIGAQSSQSMRVQGEGAALPGIDFLERVARGERVDTGGRVVIVGGGNTAIDASRTAVRLGAKEVTILYRRTREEMPADDLEVDAALAEGVKIHFLAAPIAMEKSGGEVSLTCIRMELGEPDASGRRRPKPIDGSEFKIEATSVIAAIGQGVDADCLDDSSEIRLTKWNTLDVDPETFETSRLGVFAGGDCSTGADIAVRAIAAGRKAAASIGQHLIGEPVTGDSMGYLHRIAEEPEGLPDAIRQKVADNPGERVPMPELPPKKRVRGWDEVEKGYDRDGALEEAARCVSCGCRTYESCKLRKYALEFGAEPERFAGSRREIFVDDSHPTIRYEAHKCIMCGSCVRVCSEVKELDALGFVRRGFSATMKPAMEKPWKQSSCDSCMKCVPMCPTGAISIRVTPAGEARGSFAGVDASKDVTETDEDTQP